MNETTTPTVKIPRRTFLAGAVATGALAFVPTTFAAGDEISDKQAEADAALASLKSMQQTLNQASDDYVQALNDQQAAQQGMESAQSQIDEANSNISTNQTKLSTRVRSMYRNGAGTFLDVLAGATTFEDFATGLDLLNDISEEDAKLVSSLKTTRETLQGAKEEYAQQEQVAARKAQEAAQAQAEAEKTVAEYQATYNSLSSEVQELIEQKRAAEEAAAQAAAEQVVAQSVAQAQKEEESQSRSQSSSNSNSSNSSNNSNSSSNSNNSSSSSNSSNTTTKKSTSTTPASSDSSSSTDGGTVVSRARSCIGSPYVWGAAGPSGYDCSGLVSYAVTGRHSHIYTSSGIEGWPTSSNPQAGDIVSYPGQGHCAVYIGGGRQIEAPTFGQTVKESAVRSGARIVRVP